VLFTSAGRLRGDLAALGDSDAALRRRLRHYARPQLLVIDLCAVRIHVESPARLQKLAQQSAPGLNIIE
jgi:hypothetical protein